MKTTTTLLLIAALLVPGIADADPPSLYDSQTGKYLGRLSSNPYDSDSVANPYGRYGSEFSRDSINNRFGKYGSKFSNDSPNNPYATNPPVIVHDDD